MDDKERVAKTHAAIAVGHVEGKAAFDDGWTCGIAFAQEQIGDWLQSDDGREWIEKCWITDNSKRSNSEVLAFILAKRFLVGDWKR